MEGVPPVDPESPAAQEFIRTHRTWRQTVDDRFFETMGIPLLRGREPDGSAADAQSVVVSAAAYVVALRVIAPDLQRCC